MARRAAMTMLLAAVLGLGMLAGVGLALPWEQVRSHRAALRLADQARAEAVFTAQWQAVAAGRSPSYPQAICPACIQAVAARGLDQAAARGYCAAACGLEK
jgi:hypothetical protein